MNGKSYSLQVLAGLAHLLDARGLQGDLLADGSHPQIRVRDSMGHSEIHPVEDFLSDEAECSDCVSRIVEHFEKSRFHSQRGVPAEKIRG
jgi:hypothetical protein